MGATNPTPCPCWQGSPSTVLLSSHPAPRLLQKLQDLAVCKYLGWEVRDYRTPLLGNQGLMNFKKKKKANFKQSSRDMPAGFTETRRTTRVHPLPQEKMPGDQLASFCPVRIPSRLKAMRDKTEVTVALGFHTRLCSVCHVRESC